MNIIYLCILPFAWSLAFANSVTSGSLNRRRIRTGNTDGRSPEVSAKDIVQLLSRLRFLSNQAGGKREKSHSPFFSVGNLTAYMKTNPLPFTSLKAAIQYKKKNKLKAHIKFFPSRFFEATKLKTGTGSAKDFLLRGETFNSSETTRAALPRVPCELFPT